MKRILKYLALFLIVGAIFPACDEKQTDELTEFIESSEVRTLKNGLVGEWMPMPEVEPAWWYMVNPGEIEMCKEEMNLPFYDAGNVHFFNDDSYMYVKVVGEINWHIEYFSMNIWAEGDPDINSRYQEFPYQLTFDFPISSMPDSLVYKIPYDPEWDDCFVFNIKLLLRNNDGSGVIWWLTNDNTYRSWDFYIEYCWQDCDCSPDGYRTQTQGGWGSKPNGNNPGMYRSIHFDDTFPDGLTVGGDYTLLLNSSQAVEDFLPSGGQPAALGEDYEDPSGKELKNSFAGQVVALTLSVEFDKNDPDFSDAETLLEDLVFAEGTGFEGYTVGEILADANKVLGGGDSDYGFSLNDLHEILDAVNNSFVDGEVNEEISVLVCP